MEKRVKSLKAVNAEKTKYSFENLLMFLMGMFSTMPIVGIKLLGHYFSFFNIFFGLSFVYLFFSACLKGFNLKIGKNVLLIMTWFAMAIISSLCGWLYFKDAPQWRDATSYYTSRVCLYIGFAFLLGLQEGRDGLTKYVLKGLLVGCILNMGWSVIDAAGFYLLGVSVNNVVFRQYAIDHNTRFGTVSLIINGMIRAGGFNDDPAHMGFIAPAMIAYSIYKKKGWIFILSVASIVSSTSTTALVCTLFVIVVNFKRIRLMANRQNVLRAVAGVAVLMFIVLIIPMGRSMVATVFKKFFGRISSTYSNIHSSGERSVYIFQFFKAVTIAGPMCLIGTGFGTASYAYVFDEQILQQLGTIYNFPYDMEMTYISYFFDLGIFGFGIYMLILYKLLKFTGNISEGENGIARALLVGMILSAFFYHYTIMAMQVLLLIVGMANLDLSYQKQQTADSVVKLAGSCELNLESGGAQ